MCMFQQIGCCFIFRHRKCLSPMYRWQKSDTNYAPMRRKLPKKEDTEAIEKKTEIKSNMEITEGQKLVDKGKTVIF